MQLVYPFGPPIGKFVISNNKIEQLNEYAETLLIDYDTKNSHPETTGWLGYEIKIPEEKWKNTIEEFSKNVNNYLNHFYRNSQLEIMITNAWLNSMKNLDVNPLHHHKGDGMLIVIGFLKLPEGLQKEHQEEIELSKKGAARKYAGFLNLVYGSNTHFSNSVLKIKPEVGDFYIFPSDVSHCVNPYFSSGERRSIAVNFNYRKKE